MRRAPVPTLSALLDGREGEDDLLELPEEVAHYLLHVLRLKVDARVELFDGEGLLAIAELVEHGSSLRAQVIEIIDVTQDQAKPRLLLASAIPKGDRWEWLLEKATELGVDTILPLMTQRSVVRIPEKKKAKKKARWSHIVQSASRQSHRDLFPALEAQRALTDLVDEFEACDEDKPLHIVAALHTETTSLHEACRASRASRVCLWVGPEGGWTKEELELLSERLDARFVTLGDYVLRAETAAIAMLAIAQSILSELDESAS